MITLDSLKAVIFNGLPLKPILIVIVDAKKQRQIIHWNELTAEVKLVGQFNEHNCICIEYKKEYAQ